MYEMLIGYPPFYSDDPITTCRKVRHMSDFIFLVLVYHRCMLMIIFLACSPQIPDIPLCNFFSLVWASLLYRIFSLQVETAITKEF